jgi:hypothetical protein
MKVHLKSCAEPVAITGTMNADCGKEVREARTVCMWDGQAMGASLDIPRNVCPRCTERAKAKPQRYTFGICEARMLKQNEALYV